MSDPEIKILREELSEIRKEMQQGFSELRDWKQSADVGMKGDEAYGVWGYQQKINHNKDQINTHENRINSVELKVNKILWTAAGAGAAAGTVGGVIFTVIQIWMGL